MNLFQRRHELLDRRVLGGRLYLGSVLWAACHLSLGVLLWWAHAYLSWFGADPRWMLLTLTTMCVALLFRRSHPGVALALGTVAFGADALVGPSAAVLLTYGDVLYSAGVWGRRRLAFGTSLVVLAGNLALLVFLLVVLEHLPRGLLDLLQIVGSYALVFGVPTISGLSVREHHLRAESERKRAQQVARMAELDRSNAVAEERGRMARELHDVIANHLSAVAVQSTAALSMREPDPERVRQVLSVIRDNSVQGLAEMRRMISVLRADDNPDLERVTPRLSETDRLVATAREAGLSVRFQRDGAAGRLPVQVDATAYRIVQESLTNALRYAEPRRVDIDVDYVAPRGRDPRGHLVVTAENPVTASVVPHREEGGGAGLLGMRERVALLGGTLEAGPAGGDGGLWRVRAELPVEPEADGGPAAEDEEEAEMNP